MGEVKIDLVVSKFEDSLRILEEALNELRRKNEEVATLVERQASKLAVAKTISEALYLLGDPSELFDALLILLSKIVGFDLPFITFFNSGTGFNTVIRDDKRKPLVEKFVAEILLSEENPFETGVLKKHLDGESGFQVLLVAPVEVNEEFKGFVGVLGRYREYFCEDDINFLREISQNLSTFLRQKMLLSQLEVANKKLKESLKSSIILIQKIIELKDPYGKIHGDNVADLVAEIAKRMGIENEKLEYLTYAAMIHDVGKISLPAEIVHKPAPLTEVEFALIKLHPEIGYEFLRDLSFPYAISEIIYQHHERWNGSGYPRGLKNGEILLEARILSVAEVVESMSHFRAWRDAYPIEEVLKHLQENKNILFDPQVVDICVEVFNSGFRFKL